MAEMDLNDLRAAVAADIITDKQAGHGDARDD